MHYQRMACPTRRGGTPQARKTRRQGTDFLRLRHADQTQKKGGTPYKSACGPSARHARAGGRTLLEPRGGGRGGGTPRAACVPSAWHARKGAPKTQINNQRGLPKKHAPPVHILQGVGGGEGGSNPSRKVGGALPEQARMSFVHGMNQEKGGKPQNLRRNPLTARRSGGEGRGMPGRERRRRGGTSPIRGEGDARRAGQEIMAQIIHPTPGGGPHSGQTPALAQQAQSRGARRRGGRGRMGFVGEENR